MFNSEFQDCASNRDLDLYPKKQRSLIDDQDGLKAAVDLNTRVTAELGIILTQIWRLEAAAGVNGGQLGVVDAATLAEERKFRSMEVPK